MLLNILFRALFFFLLLSVLPSFASSSFISDGVFLQSQALLTGRNLLQTRKDCPMTFEFQNYTIITSQCKGPKFPPKECCAALKEFACPFANYINDLSTNCANAMFSYIYIHGNYPPGLFANQCKDHEDGLVCPPLPPAPATSADANEATTASSLSLTVSVVFMVLVNLF